MFRRVSFFFSRKDPVPEPGWQYAFLFFKEKHLAEKGNLFFLVHVLSIYMYIYIPLYITCFFLVVICFDFQLRNKSSKGPWGLIHHLRPLRCRCGASQVSTTHQHEAERVVGKQPKKTRGGRVVFFLKG